jgi:hypothetical protein
MGNRKSVSDRVCWESGANQLTRTDLEEGVAIAALCDEVVTEKKVRSACFAADLFITFMIRLGGAA